MRKFVIFSIAAALCVVAMPQDAAAQNSLTVTSERPFTGTYSMKVNYTLGSNKNVYVLSNDPSDEVVHRVSVKVYADETGGFFMQDNDKHQILKGRNPGSSLTVWRAHLRKITQVDPLSEYRVAMWCNSNGTLSAADEFVGEVYLIPDKWQHLNFEWTAESSPGAGDGTCKIWRATNYAGAAGRTDISGTSSFTITSQMMGATDFRFYNNTVGPVFYDDFESFRTTQP